MNTTALMFITVTILSITGWICFYHDKDTIATICFVIVAGLSVGTCTCEYDCNTKDTPTALDVYRGKTTLEITYRDSVAIDSVVVYKMK